MHHYQRQSLYKLQGYACALCGCEDSFLEVDHVIPRAAGGGDELVNLQLLCQPCNNIKAGYTPSELEARGHVGMASQLREILNARASWTEDTLISLLSEPPPVLKEAPYETYRLLTNPQHAFGRKLTALMQTRQLSESALQRLIKREVGSCYGRNIARWRRSYYPSPKFFKAISKVLEWDIEDMCRYVDFRKYQNAPRHAPLFPLMPVILHNGITQNVLVNKLLMMNAYPGVTQRHIQRYLGNGILVIELLPALLQCFPGVPEDFFTGAASLCVSLADLAALDTRGYTDTKLPGLSRHGRERHRMHGFQTFIKLAIKRNGFYLTALNKLSPVPFAYQATLLHPNRRRLTYAEFAFCNVLGDFTVLDVPAAYLPVTWNRQEVQLRTSLALKRLLQSQSDAALSSYSGRDMIRSQANYAIPKAAFGKIREALGWLPREPAAARHRHDIARYALELKAIDARIAKTAAQHRISPPYSRLNL